MPVLDIQFGSVDWKEVEREDSSSSSSAFIRLATFASLSAKVSDFSLAFYGTVGGSLAVRATFIPKDSGHSPLINLKRKVTLSL